MCGVASMTVVRWIDSGALPAVRTPGGWRRVRRADAERHAAKVAGRIAAPTLTPLELAALLTGGRREALIAWVRAHAGTERTVGGLVRSHLAPAMQHIGEEWECGDASVGEEHRATGLVYEVLTLLRDTLPGPALPDGAPRLLMVCAPGEEHALPSRMAAERFLDAGWRVDYLGANVPASDTTHQLVRTNAAALGLSVTASAAGARAVLREVTTSAWRGAIVVGGALAGRIARGRPDLLVDDGSDEFVAGLAARIGVGRERAE